MKENKNVTLNSHSLLITVCKVKTQITHYKFTRSVSSTGQSRQQPYKDLCVPVCVCASFLSVAWYSALSAHFSLEIRQMGSKRVQLLTDETLKSHVRIRQTDTWTNSHFIVNNRYFFEVVLYVPCQGVNVCWWGLRCSNTSLSQWDGELTHTITRQLSQSQMWNLTWERGSDSQLEYLTPPTPDTDAVTSWARPSIFLGSGAMLSHINCDDLPEQRNTPNQQRRLSQPQPASDSQNKTQALSWNPALFHISLNTSSLVRIQCDSSVQFVTLHQTRGEKGRWLWH